MGLDRISLNASNVRYVLYTIQLFKDLSMWTAAAKNLLYEQTYPRFTLMSVPICSFVLMPITA